MATHTPAQAIQELVNHTAVLTERLVGMQGEIRKGMAMSPEWGNSLTQVVGDTKRMLMAMEHLARLPAFHLDRDGLNAAVAAGVKQGMAGEGGSLLSVIESNSRYLEEARAELNEAKERMDKMMAEVQSIKVMGPEDRGKLLKQFGPAAGAWSAGMVIVGMLLGQAIFGGSEAPPPPPAAPITSAAASIQIGQTISLPRPGQIFNLAGDVRPAFTGPAGTEVRIEEIRADAWIRVSFPLAGGKRGSGWMSPGSLSPEPAASTTSR